MHLFALFAMEVMVYCIGREAVSMMQFFLRGCTSLKI